MMNVAYDVDENGAVVNVRFLGLEGWERVSTAKEAMNLLQVRNPALVFTNDAKNGCYDALPDERYAQLLHAVEVICYLWRYKEDEPPDTSTQGNMNPLMLLANAIELISRLELRIRELTPTHDAA